MRALFRALWVAPLIAGCSLDIGSIEDPRAFTIAEQDLINTNNQFAFKIFRELVAQSDRDDNIFISPVNIAMALAMTSNGARGATRDSMLSVLELLGVDLQGVNEVYRSMIDLLRGLDPTVEFAIANSIWYREGLPVQQPFVDLNQTYFDAVVTPLDFGSSLAAPTINRWVSDNTNGRIEEIVDDPIDPATMMFLINAIYFKGDWTYQFDPDLTTSAPFYRRDGTESTIDLMAAEEKMPFLMTRDAGLQVGDLSYGGGAWRMTIVLPREPDGLATVLDAVDGAVWDTWTGSLDSTAMEVRLPRFTLEYEDSLKGILTALGMGIAFGGNADFNGIAPGGLLISDVKHKTFLEVNEEGTEAAAVTSVVVDRSSSPSFTVNRPFFFVIRESQSGSILFMGRIMDPAG